MAAACDSAAEQAHSGERKQEASNATIGLPTMARLCAGPEIKELMSYGCQNRTHAVQLLGPQLLHEDYRTSTLVQPESDSPGTRASPTPRPCSRASPGVGQFDPLSGVILHEAKEFRALAECAGGEHWSLYRVVAALR